MYISRVNLKPGGEGEKCKAAKGWTKKVTNKQYWDGQVVEFYGWSHRVKRYILLAG